MQSIPSGQRALRRRRVSLTGQAYFVTTVCAGRRRLFADPDVGHAAVRVLSEACLWRGGELLAWVLMPDHWHGLLQLAEDGNLPGTMQRAKANSSREIVRASGIAAPIWQAGFHDRALRTEEDFRSAARYLVANPLRAGLVSTLAEYPFWESRWGEDTLAG